MFTETVTQRQALPNALLPQTLNNSYANTGAVDMSKSKRAFFELVIGANAGSITASLQESADNSTWPANGSASSFTNSAGSSVQATGLTSASKVYTFEVRADQLTPGKRYVRLNVGEVNSAAVLVACTAIGEDAVQSPNNGSQGTQLTTQYVVS